MEETTWNKLHLQNPENICHHLQGVGHIVLAALHAAQSVYVKKSNVNCRTSVLVSY